MLNGRLFTRDFLLEGIRETDTWREVEGPASDATWQRLDSLLRALAARKNPNEGQTEDDLIYPVLELLGWVDRDVQANASVKARLDVPDALLYPNTEAKTIAGTLDEWKRFQHGACVVEAKRWNRPLDREVKDEKEDKGTPSSQMLRYLRRVDDRTLGRLRWGVLTNGRIWRLYFHTGAGAAENFFEIDLGMALNIEGCEADLVDKAKTPEAFASDVDWRQHVVRLFILMFRREAFLPEEQGKSFHGLALQEGQRWELKVAKNLSDKVFRTVFPDVARALAKADPNRPVALDAAYLEKVRNGALILLYRLLFVLYAEDRNLLPDESGPYAEYCLTRMRLEIAKKAESGTSFPKGVANLWPRLVTIFKAIADGNDDLGIPPYNGGLFDRNSAPILERVQLQDADLSGIIFALSHEQEIEAGKGPRYINYRDLSVQQLGSVYERLLEFQLKPEGDDVVVTLNAFGRKSSGSYYTPDELVNLIIDRTVGPLVSEAEEAFKTQVSEKSEKLEVLDPAQAILNLKICDPAMGSGHFLVTLVDWMTDRVLEAMDNSERLVSGYTSPVVGRIEAIRSRILSQAKEHKWPIVESHLDNRQVVRRMVLKRCVYGVDLNPMAVELAKVALWLHSFTVGAPLSFLDHHLVCGNALFGERVRPVMDWAKTSGLFVNEMTNRAQGSARAMAQVESMTDADVAEVRTSKTLFGEVREVTQELRSFMDLVHGVRWVDAGGKARSRAIKRLQRGDFGNPLQLLSGAVPPPTVSAEQRKLLVGTVKQLKTTKTDKQMLADAEDRLAIPGILEDVRVAIGRERFLHWEVAFPGVWSDWESNEPDGGFDAVIGNPPWDRMKFQEVEWFADRRPEIALTTRAADRNRMVEALLEGKDPIVADYRDAVARSEGSTRVARDSGSYPLLSRGDTNLYALFVERALALLKPAGIVGLLTPSGIASDKSASEFFKSVATKGRLGHLLDFENRGIFFEDVHNSFKFCVLVIAGAQRKFPATTCAFFLHSVETLDNPDRCFELTPDDFSKVNPNTGTAPIFRTRRDADITTGIYSRVPVLVDRRKAEPKTTYPVRYCTMFHMTNDSHLFMTKAELEKSAYPVGGGRWRKGAEEFVPLMVGRSIKQFDHRAASVLVNEENLHNSALSGDTTEEQRSDFSFNTSPQYWVSKGAVDWPIDLSAGIAFRDIARPTDVRTMIAALVPICGAGNTLPLILPDLPEGKKAARAKSLAEYQGSLAHFVGNLNAMPFDYVARQKVQSTHLNWYIVEQLPVLPPEMYQRNFGAKSASDIVREEVLALTYTAHDMAPFARDMGYVDAATGEVKPPFVWNARDRLRRRAKLDALYFMLYFPSGSDAELEALRDTATYIYSTFPIVEREEQASHGRYLSRDLCLHYINALAAGDPDAMITV